MELDSSEKHEREILVVDDDQAITYGKAREYINNTLDQSGDSLFLN
jgi:hypothetical protein